ncbi:hypothetical protein SESBI_21090 [Sesbania bispinosa]|nr:hypothetical protein SESBI_21090 [Sesbania bispinosa]
MAMHEGEGKGMGQSVVERGEEGVGRAVICGGEGVQKGGREEVLQGKNRRGEEEGAEEYGRNCR